MAISHDGQNDHIRLAHGGGGELMRNLVRDVLTATLGPEVPSGKGRPPLEDAAVLSPPHGSSLAFTTDSFVVSPRFFPGGNVGDLAINGTVNDLAMAGATPTALSVALILEEGLPMSELVEIVETMARAARFAQVPVVTGDTKVVPRGQGDGIYITTTGVGVVRAGARLSSGAVEAGDKILVSGPLGDHGTAVMSRRAGLSFEADLVSDCAPLHDLVAAMLNACPDLHALRDPTRGGLAAALNEFAEDSRVGIAINESSLPLRPVVETACETLGLDPLHVPSEGRLVAAAPAAGWEKVLDAMKGHPQGKDSQCIGEAFASERPHVVLQTRVGGQRRVDLPAGELLPRIC